MMILISTVKTRITKIRAFGGSWVSNARGESDLSKRKRGKPSGIDVSVTN